jgi:aspartate ammonia-lyase
MGKRVEKDLIGSKEIDDSVVWGIHTERAQENFPISRLRLSKNFICAYIAVKKACAQANKDLGYLDVHIADMIIRACDELVSAYDPIFFPVDALQGGAGTSTNMNVNEVIAHRANELLQKEFGAYATIHPIEHVNLYQSTNDTYPTALKIACIELLRHLSSAIEKVQGALQRKEKMFAAIITLGRTELQDAVPITLGSQFASFAEAFARDRWRTFKCEERIRTVNLGGTAVGTGLTAPRDYIFLVIEKLRTVTGLGLARAENMVDHTANTDSFVEISGILKAHAQNLIKISGDLRLLHYFGEIRLTQVQAGSSIMPGKVNPVICESLIQVGMKIIANDHLITDACSRGTLQMNEFMPVISYALLESLEIASAANMIFAEHIDGIQADSELCKKKSGSSAALITAFLPYIGYEKATDLIRDFKESGRSDLVGFLSHQLDEELVKKVLSPHSITSLGFKKDE